MKRYLYPSSAYNIEDNYPLQIIILFVGFLGVALFILSVAAFGFKSKKPWRTHATERIPDHAKEADVASGSTFSLLLGTLRRRRRRIVEDSASAKQPKPPPPENARLPVLDFSTEEDQTGGHSWAEQIHWWLTIFILLWWQRDSSDNFPKRMWIDRRGAWWWWWSFWVRLLLSVCMNTLTLYRLLLLSPL